MVHSRVKSLKRCDWSKGEEIYVTYHDEEWGVPVFDDHKLFEFLVLEGAQAGLSWLTTLRKRENYRRLFANFDPKRVARFDGKQVERLLLDPGIVRNRAKVEATLTNARAFLEIQREFGSFAAYQWRFVDGRPLQNRVTSVSELPVSSPISDALSKDLKHRGFKFVGSTIMYAHMQAVGMVNDHLVSCHRYRTIAKLGVRAPRALSH